MTFHFKVTSDARDLEFQWEMDPRGLKSFKITLQFQVELCNI